MTDYTALLKEHAENNYAAFAKKLLPDTNYPVLGVRVPEIKKITSIAIKTGDYVSPTKYAFYEECMLDGLIIASGKQNIDEKIKKLNIYLDHVNSWGLTDSVAAAFKDVKKEQEKAEKFIYTLLNSGKTYKIRFAIVLLTLHFCGDNFKQEHLTAVLKTKYGEYYVDMAIAWYISLLIIKNRNVGLSIIQKYCLPTFIHNKAIQKTIESFRVSEEDKNYLKSFRINNRNFSI